MSNKLHERSWFIMIKELLVPICLLVLSAVTWHTNRYQNDERLEFERSNAQSLLALQNSEYFLKKTEHDVSMKKTEADFLKTAFSECNINGRSAIKQISNYADVQFPPSERKELMKRVEENCSSDSHSSIDSNKHKQTVEDFVQSGNGLMKAKSYDEAVEKYIEATKVTPNDAALWDHRAYAQYRAGNYNDAMNSISVAIRIGSNNERTNSNIAINAAKILCAQGNLSGGKNYIQQAINAFPYLFNVVKRDGELLRVCSLTVPTDK